MTNERFYFENIVYATESNKSFKASCLTDKSNKTLGANEIHLRESDAAFSLYFIAACINILWAYWNLPMTFKNILRANIRDDSNIIYIISAVPPAYTFQITSNQYHARRWRRVNWCNCEMFFCAIVLYSYVCYDLTCLLKLSFSWLWWTCFHLFLHEFSQYAPSVIFRAGRIDIYPISYIFCHIKPT